MATENPPSPTGNKRKRGQNDTEGGGRRQIDRNVDTGIPDPMYLSLLQGIGDASQHNDPSRTAQAALQQQPTYPEPSAFDSIVRTDNPQQDLVDALRNLAGNTAIGQTIFNSRGPHTPKPSVGTKEWHQLRKDNHKEGMHRSNIVISSFKHTK